MAKPRRVLVVGGGIARVHAALGARAADSDAQISVFSEEDCLPYDRTALSKDVLMATAAPSAQLLFPQAHYEEQRVQLQCGERIVSIDSARKQITTQAGVSHDYDALILATGTSPRRLPGTDAQDVFYLRTHADATALQPKLKQARRLIVIGAGLIGLEVAAAARALGVEVDVLEAGDAILSRACDAHTAAAIGGLHEREGVKIHTRVRIIGIDRSEANALRVELTNGERLETWRHAQDHGHFVGRNAAGERVPFDAVPTFWSDQFGHRIQGAGLLERSQSPILRSYEDGSHTCFLVNGEGRARAAVGIDRPQDINGARRLIAAQLPIDPALLADASMPVPRIVKQLRSS